MSTGRKVKVSFARKKQGNGFFLESLHSGVVLKLSKAVSFQYISSCFGEPTTLKSFHSYFIAAILPVMNFYENI